ncbi:hypothetical protein AgCh_004553 [Apium graveolens]
MLIGEEQVLEEVTKVHNLVSEMEKALHNPDLPGEISLNALSRNNSSSTISLQGKFKGRKLNILVDSGSTHNFIDGGIAIQMGVLTKMKAPLIIIVADGTKVLVDTICK